MVMEKELLRILVIDDSEDDTLLLGTGIKAWRMGDFHLSCRYC